MLDWIVTFAFPDSAERALFSRSGKGIRGHLEMSQFTYALLIAVGLTLTGYFGMAAWQLSGDDQVTTGAILRHR
jgi:hypothetical protein